MGIKKGQIVELTIDDAAYKGKGVGKIDGLPVFVPCTAPGDTVRARIINRKKSYKEAKLLELLEPSPLRINPKCRHARVCGGCSWQHVSYEDQLRFKGQQVKDHIERIGGLANVPVHDTLGCETPFYYRNKMEYSFGTRRWLTEEEISRDEFVDDSGLFAGLHAPGRFDKILDLEECHLQVPESYEILDFVRSWCKENKVPAFDNINKTGFMRNLMIRNSHYTDDFMVNIVTYADDADIIRKLTGELLRRFSFITTVVNNINDTKSPTSEGRIEKVYHGPGYITDRIGDFEFKIHPNAFFQTNTAQAERLYEVARSYTGLKKGDVIYDLYCGVGTLSLYMSRIAERVVGIELVEVAIENARFNTRENNIDNVAFVKGDMKEVFNNEMTEEYGEPDVLVTDPPRAGMHPDVVQRLCELKVPNMVYVSCNSSTMARDLKKLSEVYHILEVQPVDMFPQTYHVEAVARLRLK